MTIVSAIIQLLGGLAMFLYGIEVMGDGLKNSSGAALKRVLEKVTGNVVMGVLTGALVTAVIQSSTATIVLTVALIGAGVLNLKQAVSIVLSKRAVEALKRAEKEAQIRRQQEAMAKKCLEDAAKAATV